MAQTLWGFSVAGAWEASFGIPRKREGLAVRVDSVPLVRGANQICSFEGMLDGVVQCFSGDKSYFRINWKWLIAFFRNSTYLYVESSMLVQ